MGKVTPEMFSSDTPPERIMGVECEYHLETKDTGLSAFISGDAMIAAGFLKSADYLNDGSRLYTDVGHIEYCTPESYGPYAAADADIDGIDKVSAVIAASGKAHDGIYRISGTTLKNDPEAKNHYTNGVHENLMFPAKLVDDQLLRGLVASHLATRIWAMSGNVYDGTYEWSQKVNGIGPGSSGKGGPIEKEKVRRTDRGGKPMALFLRGDSDTMSSGWWARGEIRFADPQLSRYGRRLSLAALSLVFRLGEQQHHFTDVDRQDFEKIILKNPFQAATGFMTDVSLTRKFEVMSGHERTAMDIQRSLFDKVHKLLDIIDLPGDERDAVRCWSEVNDAIMRSTVQEADYDKHLIDHFDAFAKHALLVHSGSLQDDQVAKGRSLLWDRISPTGLGQKYWLKKREKLPPGGELHWITPLTERTKARISVIEAHGTGANVSWLGANIPRRPRQNFPEPWG